MSFCQGAKHNSGDSVVAIVAKSMTSLIFKHGRHCMPYSLRILSELLPEIRTMEISILHSLIV